MLSVCCQRDGGPHKSGLFIHALFSAPQRAGKKRIIVYQKNSLKDFNAQMHFSHRGHVISPQQRPLSMLPSVIDTEQTTDVIIPPHYMILDIKLVFFNKRSWYITQQRRFMCTSSTSHMNNMSFSLSDMCQMILSSACRLSAVAPGADTVTMNCIQSFFSELNGNNCFSHFPCMGHRHYVLTQSPSPGFVFADVNVTSGTYYAFWSSLLQSVAETFWDEGGPKPNLKAHS